MNQLNHITLAPARFVDRKVGYFVLPTFSYSFAPTPTTTDSTAGTVDTTTLTVDLNTRTGADYSWAGASVIVAQFNFSASKNFVLEDLPEAPADANFCLCIRYRVGDEVYRYKLWENVDEVLNVPLYNGEVIKKNFVLEVWTVKEVNAAANNIEIKLRSSILELQSTDENDADNSTEYEDAVGVEFTNLLSQEEDYDTSEVSRWYRFEAGALTQNDLGYVTAMTSYLPDTSVTGTLSGTSQLTIIGDLDRYMFPRFGTGYFYSTYFNGEVLTLPRAIFLVHADSNTSAVASNYFIDVGNVAVSIDSSDNLHVFVQGNQVTLTDFSTRGWVVIDVIQNITDGTIGEATVSFAGLDGEEIQSNLVSINALIDSTNILTLADGNPPGSIYIGDIILFTTAPSDIDPIYGELRKLYGYTPIPTTFDEGVKWLDND